MESPRGTVTIAPGVHWVGVKHDNRRLFDALIPLPHGTSYNSYLIVGQNKTALIDTVNPGFEDELLGKIAQHVDPSKIDYIVMNHAEPDHASALARMMEVAKDAKMLAGGKGKEAAMMYFGIPADRIQVVDETTKIPLGGKTLSFVDAPWLHWPETIFTFLEEDKILFPCDFFGSHTASGDFYAHEFGDGKSVDLAKLYFAEIMMPFRKPGLNALEKVGRLGPKMIAPSHGVIWREPKVILDEYAKWDGEKFEKKVLIVYVSMWGSCEKMARALQQTLVKKGVNVNIFDVPSSNIGDIAKELVDSPILVVAAPTVLSGVHPVAAYAAMLVKALRAPTRYGAVLTSYGWGAGAVRQLQEILTGTKMEMLGVVEVKGPPKQAELDKIYELADKIEEKLGEF